MSSSFYPLGMNSYNNRLPQGGYKASKGVGVFSNQTGVTAGNIRPLTNNDPTNNTPQKFGLPRPIKHYRKGISVTSLENSTNSRQVKSSTGGGSLIGQMIDIPGGFSIKENPSNEISNTEELDRDCLTCQGVGIISDWQPITDLTEKPEPETQTPQYCCNEERNSLRRLRSANTKLKKNYYTSTPNYLYNRCQTFEQKQFNYLSSGTSTVKPGAPLSQNNNYKANCNPNLEIEYATSLLSDAITLTPSNPLGCETVQYKPNNYKYGQQGAVSSSDRLLRLNVETIDTNRANIIKSQENLTKSKYFPNASGSENNSCCIIGSKAVASFGTTILYITYPVVTRTFRTLTHRFSFPSSFSSISDPPVPVIQNEYILVVPSYELIDPNTNKVKMTLKYQLFTNNDAELLTVGLSFANNVNYYNQNTSIIEIIQFDGMPLYGLGNQFSGLTPQILISAPDEPRIIPGTSALNCFKDCTNFNSPGILNWNIANVVNMSGMFQNATIFNQNISSWDTSNAINMSYMFYGAILFDNGQTGTQDISGNFSSATYTNSTRLLTCPNSKFLTQLLPTDVLIITAGTPTTPIIYTSQIQSSPILSDVSLVLLTAYGSNILTGITSIKKQVAGSAPLTWNTSNVTTMNSIFQNATYFNQRVSTWDVSKVTDMGSAFQGFQDSIVYTNILLNVFNNGELAGSNHNLLNNWNTGNATNMSYTFSLTSGFNQYLSIWNTSKVTNISGMFYSAIVFNNGLAAGISSNDASLNGWDTSKVTSMMSVFQQDAAFNQNISSWDVSKVTNMNTMFYLATNFNNGDSGNFGSKSLSGWTAPLCTDFSLMFLQDAAFNQNVSNLVDSSGIILDASGNGVSLSSMFQSATKFNQNLNTWNTSKVSNMSSVFSTASVFNNGDASGANTTPLNWITDNVTTMSAMFVNALVFNQPIDTSGNYWNTGKVTNMLQMLAGGSVTLLFNQPIGRWDVSNCTTMFQMFYGANKFNQDISLWKTGNVTTMSQMFRAATLFNQTINTDASGSWNVSKVTDMSSMFSSATSFNNGRPLGTNDTSLNWYAPACTTFASMFLNAAAFNQPIPFLVDTSGITLDASGNGVSLASMFQNSSSAIATTFNQNLSSWNVSRVTAMNLMFSRTGAALPFNNGSLINDASNTLTWYAPNCTTFASMFVFSTAFNQPIPFLVDTSGIALPAGCNLTSMFQNAAVFNQNLNGWNVSRVINMTLMFSGTIFNNGDISGNSTQRLTWYAPNCNTFSTMFNAVSAFNQPLPYLVDTSGNTNPSGCSLNAMFQQATRFNQNLNTWNVSRATSISLTFSGATAFNNGSLTNDASNTLIWNAPMCTTFASMFLTANSFNQPIPILVDTSGVTGCSLASMFQTAQRFNQNLNTWNVSRVTNMSLMFQSATSFNNGSLTNDASNTLIWNAPASISFVSMFQSATAFNQPIPFLVDTSGVAVCTMNSMFVSATSFNQNIGSWNVSKANPMNNMFSSATSFNNGGSNTIQTWYAPICTSFVSMFQSATAFNQPIPFLVDTSGVAVCTMNSMFVSATSFNQNIGSWNVSKATTLASMFSSATSFNNGGSTGIQNWSAPASTAFNSMFQSATVFNQPLTNLVNTSSVANCVMNSMFFSATAFNNGQLGTMDISGNVGTASYTVGTSILSVPGAAFNADLSLNDVLIITTSSIYYTSQIQRIISDASLVLLTPGSSIASGITFIKKQVAGTADLSWNTQNVTTMASMFQNAYYFNQNISNWSTSNVVSMSLMFAGASTTAETTFNNGQLAGSSGQPLNWTASKCNNFVSMFANTAGFNQPVPTLVDTSTLPLANCTMTNMFNSASVFNQNVNTWNTSNVTNMSSVFSGTSVFNNGQSVTQTVTGTPSLASYSNASPYTLTCPDASFNLDFSSGDGIIITTGGSAIYSSVVANISSDTSLTLSTYPISISLAAGVITSIKKQVAGTAEFDLSWNTQNVTTVASIFQNATYFNQRLPWNTRKIGINGMTTAFIGRASFINIFNNGQIITGITQPLSTGLGTTWDFSGNAVTVVAGGAWRANCRLTAQNGVTVNPAIY